jgi:hypothetical protein
MAIEQRAERLINMKKCQVKISPIGRGATERRYTAPATRWSSRDKSETIWCGDDRILIKFKE